MKYFILYNLGWIVIMFSLSKLKKNNLTKINFKDGVTNEKAYIKKSYSEGRYRSMLQGIWKLWDNTINLIIHETQHFSYVIMYTVYDILYGLWMKLYTKDINHQIQYHSKFEYLELSYTMTFTDQKEKNEEGVMTEFRNVNRKCDGTIAVLYSDSPEFKQRFTLSAAAPTIAYLSWMAYAIIHSIAYFDYYAIILVAYLLFSRKSLSMSIPDLQSQPEWVVNNSFINPRYEKKQ